MKFKVGDKLYYKDSYGWNSTFIIGETTRSWLVFHWKDRVNKKTLIKAGGRYCDTQHYTEEGMKDEIWKHENKCLILEALRCCQSINKLKKIKEILE